MRYAAIWVIALLAGPMAAGQGLAGDLLGGTLIKPRVGQWSWYDLHDTQNDAKYAVREAIVDKERVGRETGYWLEIEIVPQVGYKTILKALLTGPASDTDNIKRLIVKYGLDPVQEVPVNEDSLGEDAGEGRRESLGMEEVLTRNGTIRAEHFRVVRENEVVDMWINRDVLPTGIVKLRSPRGEWVLRTHGYGGKDGQTQLPHGSAPKNDQPSPGQDDDDNEGEKG